MIHTLSVLACVAIVAVAEEKSCNNGYVAAAKNVQELHYECHKLWLAGDVEAAAAAFADDVIIHWDTSFGPNTPIMQETYSSTDGSHTMVWLNQIASGFEFSAFDWSYPHGMSDDGKTIIADMHTVTFSEKAVNGPQINHAHYQKWVLNDEGKVKEAWYTKYTKSGGKPKDAGTRSQAVMDRWFAGHSILHLVTDDLVVEVPEMDMFIPHPECFNAGAKGKAEYAEWLACIAREFTFEKFDFSVESVSPDGKVAIANVECIYRIGVYKREATFVQRITFDDAGLMVHWSTGARAVKYTNAPALWVHSHESWAKGDMAGIVGDMADDVVMSIHNMPGWPSTIVGTYTGKEEAAKFYAAAAAIKWTKMEYSILASSDTTSTNEFFVRFTAEDGSEHHQTLLQTYTMNADGKCSSLVLAVSAHTVFKA